MPIKKYFSKNLRAHFFFYILQFKVAKKVVFTCVPLILKIAIFGPYILHNFLRNLHTYLHTKSKSFFPLYSRIWVIVTKYEFFSWLSSWRHASWNFNLPKLWTITGDKILNFCWIHRAVFLHRFVHVWSPKALV